MAINRYDQPAEAQFINTYSPVPFDELLKVGMLKQARVEKGQEGMDAVSQAMAAIKVAPGDEPAYNRLIAEKTKELEEGLKYGIGSQDQLNAVNRVRNSLVVDPRFRAYTHNYNVYNSAVEQEQKANEQKITASNRGDISNVMGILGSGGTGTDAEMAKGGSGMLNKPSFYGNVEVREEFKKYVDDVSKSSVELGGVKKDASGRYTLDEKTGGKTLTALAAPFGITFTTIQKDGKSQIVMDMDKTSLDRIMATPAAAQIARDTDLQVGKDRGSAKWQETFQKNLSSDIESTLKEFVSSDTAINWSADPYAAAEHKKKLDDSVVPFTRNIIVGNGGSTINSVERYNEAIGGFAENEKAISSRYKEYMAKNGVEFKEEKRTDGSANIVPGTVVSPKAADGTDVSQVLAGFQSELDQEYQKKKDLERKYREIRTDVGVPEGWKITDDFTEKELKALREEAFNEAQSVSKNTKEGGQDWSKVQQKTEELYAKALEKGSDNYQAINKGLKANAEKETIEIGVTPYSSKELNDVAAKDFRKFVAEGGKGNSLLGGATGVRWASNKEAFIPKDYENISGEKEALFMGVAYDSEDGYPVYVYRPFDKKGELLPPVMIEAPQGAETQLINDGFISFAQTAIHRQLAQMERNESHTGTIGSGDLKVDVRRLTNTRSRYSPVSDLYEVKLTGIDPETKTNGTKLYTFSNRKELIDFYTAFVEANPQAPKK